MTKKRNLLSIVYTVALVVVVFTGAPATASEDSKSSTGCQPLTPEKAEERCKNQEKSKDFSTVYSSLLHCQHVYECKATPLTFKGGDTCKAINDNLVEATKEFNQACAGAGINSNCEAALDRCFQSMGSSSQSTADTLLSSLGLGGAGSSNQGANPCHTQTSEQQNEQYQKEQERIQQQIKEARDDLKQAQDEIMESQRNIQEAQAEVDKLAVELNYDSQRLKAALATSLRGENEASFEKLQALRREISKTNDQITTLDFTIAEAGRTKGKELLDLLMVCEDRLTKARAEYRAQYAERVKATGGVPQTRGFNDIWLVDLMGTKELQTDYRRCMDRANKVRANVVEKANNAINQVNGRRVQMEEELKRLEDEKDKERESLVSRLGEQRVSAEIERQYRVDQLDAANRNLQAVEANERQNQAMLQGRIQEAQGRMNMGSNGMFGLGTGGEGIMGIFSGVLGAIANSGQSSGGRAPTQGINNTVIDAMNKLQAKKMYEQQAIDTPGCDIKLAGGGSGVGSGSGIRSTRGGTTTNQN